MQLLPRTLRLRPPTLHARLSTSAPHAAKPLPPRPKINESDLTENFIKGGGSGGQKINKTSSLVQLIHHPTDIHVRCQATRSRAQNRTIARRILAERIEALEQGPLSRVAVNAERDRRKKANAKKKTRRKYRKLEEGETDGEQHEENERGVEEEEGESVAEEKRESQNRQQDDTSRRQPTDQQNG